MLVLRLISLATLLRAMVTFTTAIPLSMDDISDEVVIRDLAAGESM
jgi:hypothetical protein